MATNKAAIENFISNWNSTFTDHPLTLEDLKKAHGLMGALFRIFDRLGIDRDAVLMPPPDKDLNEHMVYYWDLIPAINMTRVINHLVCVMPQVATISVNHFLQPTPSVSHYILMLMFNLMLFQEQQLQSIAPAEDELFHFIDMVKALEEKKNDLFEKLNRQAEERGKRAERMEQMRAECAQLEELIKQEELLLEKDKQELEPLIKKNQVTDLLLDQKRATKEGLLAERDRKKAMRVYDADDIRTQAAQATQSVQEVEEKLNALTAQIKQKDNSLKILQTIKPKLDTANNLLHEINDLKQAETGEVDEDSKEGEMEAARAELAELQAQEAEAAARRAEAANKRAQGQAKRQQEREQALSAVKEAEEKDKKRRELTAQNTQRIADIKARTLTYAQQKAQGFETIKQIKQDFDNKVKEFDDKLLRLLGNTYEKINKKKHEDEDGDEGAKKN